MYVYNSLERFLFDIRYTLLIKYTQGIWKECGATKRARRVADLLYASVLPTVNENKDGKAKDTLSDCDNEGRGSSSTIEGNVRRRVRALKRH